MASPSPEPTLSTSKAESLGARTAASSRQTMPWLVRSVNGFFFLVNSFFAEKTIPHLPWEHDHLVGVLVDTEKGVLQFFYDRKKVGPLLHLKDLHLGDHEVFFAVAIDTPKTAVQANWTATAPKVFLG
jgi:hypothetical protein